jgi:hypothetical protein
MEFCEEFHQVSVVASMTATHSAPHDLPLFYVFTLIMNDTTIHVLIMSN